MDLGPTSCSDVFVSEAMFRLAMKTSDNRRLRGENEELGKQNATLQEKVSNLEREHANYREEAAREASQQEAAVRKLTENIEQTKELYSALSIQHAVQRDQYHQLQDQYSLCKAENETLHQKNLSVSSELKIKVEEYQQLVRAERSTRESAAVELRNQVQASLQQTTKLQQELKAEKALHQAAVYRVASLRDQNASLQKSLDSHKAELDVKQQQIESLQRDKEALNTYVQEYDEKSTAQEELLAQQQAELETEVAMNKESQGIIRDLRAQIATLIAELKSVKRPAVERSDQVVQTDAEVSCVPPLRELASTATQTESQADASSSANSLRIRIPASQRTRQGAAQDTHPSRRSRQELAGGPDSLAETDYEIPAARRELLDSFPEVEVPQSVLEEVTVFTRTYLSSMLGGGMQGVVGTFAKNKPKTPLSLEFGLDGCIYPQRHLNPWLPHQPGDHGYLFLGLMGPGNDHKRFLSPVTHALFICKNKTWEYYGQYIVHRVPERDLTVEEWNALSDLFKDGDTGYCAMTLNKSMGGSSYEHLKRTSMSDHYDKVREIRTKYDSGELRVPCISLQCVDYYEDLVDALEEARSREVQNAPPNDGGSGLRIVLKRKHANEDGATSEEEAGSPRPERRSLRPRNE